MPPDNLFGDATSLLSSAGSQAIEQEKVNQHPGDVGAENARQASSELGADRRQAMSSRDQQKLLMMKDKLDQASNMVTVTPQIALGLVKNTGDKEWMKAVGQKYRSDVLLAYYTHGIKTEQAKKAPRVTQIYDANGKVRHAVVYTDEEGNMQQLMLDQGITPEALNKGKGSGTKKTGGTGSDESLKKMKEFNRAFEKARGEISDPSKAAQLKATNPEGYAQKEQFIKDNQDQYDANVKALGKGGGAAIPGQDAGGSSAAPGNPGNAPFDVDAFIKEATKTQ